MSRCTCSGCGHVFSSPRAFDTHRVGTFAHSSDSSPRRHSSTHQRPRRCMSEREMTTAGLVARSLSGAAAPRQGPIIWSLEASLARWTAREAILTRPGTKFGHSQQRISFASVAALAENGSQSPATTAVQSSQQQQSRSSLSLSAQQKGMRSAKATPRSISP